MNIRSSDERTRRIAGTALRALGALAAIAVLLTSTMQGCGGGSGGSGTGFGYPEVLSATGDEVIVPGYAAMAARMATLESSASAFCASPSAATLDGLRGAWRGAMGAWLEMSWVDFGPSENDNRRLRLEFWPDDNGNVRRSVEQVLARPEPVTEEVLANQSVAAQGLPALELLLFVRPDDTLETFGDPETGARRCAYAVAIAANLATIAEEIHAEWQRDGGNFVDQLALAGKGSTAFASPAAALDDVVNGVVASVEQSKNDRLGGPLGATTGTPRPEAAESRPSGNSLTNVAHALAGIRRALSGASLDVDAYLRQIGRGELADRIAAEFDDVDARLRTIPVPLSEAVTDPGLADELTALFDAATRLTRTLKNDLSFALSVTIGFNSNDGD
jgi:hypothetical protein